MKTFKLVGLSVIDGERQRQDIPFIDGLIINKEDGQNRWLVEAYLDDEYEPVFASLQQQPEFQLQVTITNPSNDPANMLVAVRSITKMNGHISVLMEGLMIPRRTRLAEIVLEGLVEKGLQGEALLQAFRQQFRQQMERQNAKAPREAKR
ncbi:YwpF-like family protein [Caldibacillus thermoamylovorans]